MFRNKNVTKVISLLIAVVLWGYVVWNTNPVITDTIKDIPVQLLSVSTLEERGLTLLDAQTEYTVDLRVQGKKKDVGNLKTADIFVTADVGGYGAGEVTVAVNVSTRDNISVIAVNPSTLVLTIDTIVENEKEVRVMLEGELPAGTEAGNLFSALDTAEVTSAKTQVDRVAYVKAGIAAADVSEEETVHEVTLIPVDMYGEEVSGVRISPSTAEVTSILYYTRSIPFAIEVTGEPAEGVQISHISVPDEILIRGTKAAVSGVAEIKGTVDITGVSENSTMKAQIVLPNGVLLSRGQSEIEATIVIDETAEDNVAQDEETPAE